MNASINQHRDLFSHVYSDFVSKAWPDKNSRLHRAIIYCLQGEGKRVRGLLSMMVCAAYGRDPRFALSAAVAVEMLHAYSLAHDDLPCMDDDNYRRGRPALHKAFDEATALLAGDAILTDAMRVLSDDSFFPDSGLVSVSQRLKIIRELSLAAGGHGMVYGQDFDLFWTGKEHYSDQVLELIHRHKTGALIGASCAMGALSGGASEADARIWREIGALIGVAFQAIDDTLDSEVHIGKTPGKDKIQKKLTYMSLHSTSEIHDIAKRLTDKAIHLIPGNVSANELIQFTRELVFRRR